MTESTKKYISYDIFSLYLYFKRRYGWDESHGYRIDKDGVLIR